MPDTPPHTNPEKGDEDFHQRLVEVLVAKGLIDEQVLDAPPEEQKRLVRIGRKKQAGGPRLRDPQKDGPPCHPVNCAERIHVCGAVCCKLSFALSRPEVDQGVAQWDPDNPYVIRQEADGFCTHLDRGSCGCTIYRDRPRPCRIYSCYRDPRIWKDFERMELNEEWIGKALGEMG